LGREDSQVKIHGYRIELGEIEAVLLKWPSIASALVTTREDQPGEKYLAAYLTARPDTQIDLEGLRGFVRESLPRYMLPNAFAVLEQWPLTPAGKVDRKALPRPEIDAGRSYEPPVDDLEAQVAAIFEKLLRVSRVGRHDGFFDLGGHSVLAARLLVELNGIAKQGVSFGTVFQRPTVAELAAVLRESGTSDDALVIPLNPGASGLPLFCVCGIQLYKDLAQALGPSQAVYGVYLPAEDKGITSARESGKLFTVEELAKGYLAAIRKQQPEGPYCLGGLSFGGVLAYEMAQQLIRAGEEVALLVLVDSTLPRALKWRPVRWTLAHLSQVMKQGPGYVAKRTSQFAAGILQKLPGLSTSDPAPADPDAPVRLEERISAYLQATARYDEVIRPYTGNILLFRACFRSDFVGYDVDPWLGWKDLVPNLEVHEASGNHLSVLKAPAVDLIAAPVRAALMSFRPPPSVRSTRRSSPACDLGDTA
jgi:thioesterase domain-containing protein